MHFIWLLFLINGNWILPWHMPNPYARDTFACDMFQSLLRYEQNTYQPIYQLVIISPASIQKLFAVFYNFSELEQIRPLARDLRLLDNKAFLSHKNRRWGQLFLPFFIQQDHVMELFANDFEELGDNISVQNFFVFDGDFELAKGFEESVWNYFNIVVLSKHQPLVSGLLQEFRLQSNGLEIYTLINFHANLGNEFLSIDRFHYGRGYFRFSEYLILGSSLADRTNCKILELPLNTASTQGLSLMLVMPPKHMKLLELEEKFLSFTSRNFWRLPYQMRYTQVSVRLPNVRFTSKLNVGILVNEMSTMHLHKLFKMETQFNGMFDSAFNRRIKVKHFVQSINMQLLAPGIAQRKEPINSHNFFNVSQTFDCGEGPFLFLVRSRDVIYFIGHYRRIPKAFRAGTQFGQF
ncbi:uncharacterized protein LOC6640356 [Drosophila willistoni]|nr:uncharacterized protein LOC6640356 [Drosophila willistoni]